MRDGIRVSTHEELIPYMTGNRHMTCVHAAAQLGCLDCVKWMVSYGGLKDIPQCIIWNSQAFTDIESIRSCLSISGNSDSKIHCEHVVSMSYNGDTESFLNSDKMMH